ncbi:hypothetical protein Acr_00g0055750 [Actinidia rufa]|uniref:Uncharacterized protein n=1 Tax=Actinidia rufa TaxID=165716 RepID=A0A7J0DP01_9ERIC|nr:hypothetical protein Acr_00g0055750 [Actinidia rufa]
MEVLSIQQHARDTLSRLRMRKRDKNWARDHMSWGNLLEGVGKGGCCWLAVRGSPHTGWLWLVVGRGLHRGDGWLLVTAPGLRRAAGLVTAQGLCRAAGWWLAVRGFVVVGCIEATIGGCVGGCWV